MILKARLLITCLVILLNCSKGICQYQYTYYLDTKLNSVPKESATIIGQGLKEKGLVKLDCFDKLTGRLLMSFHFTDSSLSELQGQFISYNIKGKTEQEGYYDKGIESGEWNEWDPLGRKYRTSHYVNGEVMSKTEFSYKEDMEIKTSAITTNYKEKSVLTSMFMENGEKEFDIHYYYGISDSVDVYRFENGIQVEKFRQTAKSLKPQFPGGKPLGWQDYLKENLDANIPYSNNAPKGVYNVIVTYIIDEEGNLTNIKAETKFGYGMEEEAIRVFKSSPKWIPGVIGNKKNKYPMKQSITFTKEER